MTSARTSQRFTIVVALLIAAISIGAAAIACRVADANERVGDADDAGLLAAADFEAVRTEGTQYLFAYLGVYAFATRNDALSAALTDALPRITDRTRSDRIGQEADALFYSGSAVRSSLPQQYIDRDLTFDAERALGEVVADSSFRKDVDALSQFAIADRNRIRGQSLLVSLVVISCALVLLTLAEATDHWVRWGLMVAGALVAAGAVLSVLMIELTFALL